MSTNTESNARGHLRNQMCLEWLRTNRPNVLRAIETEVNKKYPSKRRRSLVGIIPKEILEMP